MFLILILDLFSLPAAAQEASDDTAEVEALRERVRLLERAVDELRGTAESMQEEIPLDLQTRIRGYAALNFDYLEEYKVAGFSADELMLQYTGNLDRKMSINTELSFEVEEHGIAVGLEAMEFRIAPSQSFQLVAGQYHLPLSPWAVTASQGAYRYLTTAVPEALEEEAFEEFLPIDQLGLQLQGRVPVGFWQFGYDASVSNGRAPDPGSSAQFLDFNDFKALAGRLSIKSPGGFEVGGGAYYDLIDVHDETLLDGTEADQEEEFAKKTIIDNASELIVGASVGLQGGAVELSSEGYLTIHGYEGQSWTSMTGFFLVGVPIDRTTPFLMVDYVNVDPADPIYAIFNQTGPEIEILPGARYEVGLRLAWKAQAEIAYELDSQTWGWGLQSQLAAGF